MVLLCRTPTKSWRHHERLHPYRREVQPAYQQHSLRCKATQSNGSHTATNSNGAVNGKRLRENGNETVMLGLMEQVAAGSIHPEMAASYVNQMMSTSQVIKEVEGDDKAWGEQNMPAEIVWAPGKSASQLVIALQRVIQTGIAALAVRIAPEVAAEVVGLLPEAQHNEVARTLSISPGKSKALKRLPGTIAIIADSSAPDQVVQETVLALQIQGCYAYKLAGAGGVNSLPNMSAADSASVVIVVADSKSHLASVVASSILPPVVVVPTNENTVANSPGLTHVDHNNGLAAALIAARILRTVARMQKPRS